MRHASVRRHWEPISVVLGYVSWIGKVAERNASLTEILLECGAVLYVRTNVPQTLMVRFTPARLASPSPVIPIVVISGRRPTIWCSAGPSILLIAP